MNPTKLTLKLVVAFAFCLFCASMAQAQATRTWVSGTGDDVNPCSRTAPCKTFAGAISKTAEGGEIDALDPAGYGTITITKAITLDGTTGAGFGSILNSGVNGVTVNVTGGTHLSDAVVILRNLYIQGTSQGTSIGTNGINYVNAASLHVENCVIENQGTSGINASLSTNGNLFVSNTSFRNVNTGIQTTTTSGLVVLYVDNCKIQGNNDGVNAISNTFGEINDTTFYRNVGATNGAVSAASNSTIAVVRSDFSNNVIAINAKTGATVRAASNHIYNNSNGLTLNGGIINSDGQNRIAGNSASATPNGAAVVLQ